MKLTTLLLSAMLALSLSTGAQAAEDASHFLLTPALMQKFKNAQEDFKKTEKKKSDDDDNDSDDDSSGKKRDESIEGMIRKIEADPRARAMLAKHGIAPREFALATYAMLHAGMYVAMEKMMDKNGREKLYNGYTREQKANIALMRTYAASEKK